MFVLRVITFITLLVILAASCATACDSNSKKDDLSIILTYTLIMGSVFGLLFVINV